VGIDPLDFFPQLFLKFPHKYIVLNWGLKFKPESSTRADGASPQELAPHTKCDGVHVADPAQRGFVGRLSHGFTSSDDGCE